MYNIAKKVSSSDIFLWLNYRYYLYILFIENIDFCFKLKLANKLTNKLNNVITIY